MNTGQLKVEKNQAGLDRLFDLMQEEVNMSNKTLIYLKEKLNRIKWYEEPQDPTPTIDPSTRYGEGVELSIYDKFNSLCLQLSENNKKLEFLHRHIIEIV